MVSGGNKKQKQKKIAEKKHQWTSLFMILYIFSCSILIGGDRHAGFPILMNMFSI